MDIISTSKVKVELTTEDKDTLATKAIELAKLKEQQYDKRRAYDTATDELSSAGLLIHEKEDEIAELMEKEVVK